MDEQWEYLELTKFNAELLNDLGRQGWQLMGAERILTTPTTRMDERAWAVLKRRIDGGHEPAQKTLDDYEQRRGYPTRPVWNALDCIARSECISDAVKNAADAEKTNGCHWMGPGDSVSGGQAFLPMIQHARHEAAAAGDSHVLHCMELALRDLNQRYSMASCEKATRWMWKARGSMMWDEAMEALRRLPATGTVSAVGDLAPDEEQR